MNADTLYGGAAAGYTDYPMLEPSLAASLEPSAHPPADLDFRYRA
jgi:hypothetical protein